VRADAERRHPHAHGFSATLRSRSACIRIEE
jgi:hypothetical protein